MPQDLGKRQANLRVGQIPPNTVTYPNRPGLVGAIVVVLERFLRFLKMSLGDELVGVSKVVVGKVGAEMTNTNPSLGDIISIS